MLLALLITTSASGAILPDQIHGAAKGPAKQVEIEERAIWEEYGFDSAEAAEYSGLTGKFAVTAWRMKDPTGALGVFQWMRPAGWKHSTLAALAVESPSGVFLAFGNYVLRFDGLRPTAEALQILYNALPRLDQSALPSVAGFLPTKDLISGSERLIIGPVTLEKFEPKITPSLAAFSFGAEAQFGRFRTSGGDASLAVFSYPTPQIAKQRLEEFQKYRSLRAKRSGPLVAVSTAPVDPDTAEKLLALVRYEANITWSESTKSVEASLAEMILSIFTLAGMLILFCVVAGLAFFGVRIAGRKWFGSPSADESMILLRLKDK